MICPASPCPAVIPRHPRAIPATSGFPPARHWLARRCPRALITFRLERQSQSPLANTWTWFSLGDSSYNALQVDVNRRFSHGFSVRGVYTWSKALDDGDSLNADDGGQCAGTGFESLRFARRLGPGHL